mmetsp:Transcript_11536/g.21033  ORF Transcript_11536/g.21033 Transcript_11536/m.21033 type:complete len:382 (+) Transcript_11536:87-1232(+)
MLASNGLVASSHRSTLLSHGARVGTVARVGPSKEAELRSSHAAPLRLACGIGAALATQHFRSCRSSVRRAKPEVKAETVDSAEDEPFFEEVSGDDPLVIELEERLRKMNGDQNLTLDMVLNPGTIVNAEREVVRLRAELALTPEDKVEKRKVLEDKIEEKQMKIVNEMRQVMTDSLKLEFLLQGVLSVPAFALMSYNAFPFVPDLSFFEIPEEGSRYILQLLGVWGIWLLTIPALRARKPGGPYGMGYEEKRALDIAFLATPAVVLIVPFLDSYPPTTFWASLAVLGICYVWSFTTPLVEDDAKSGDKSQLPEPIRWALKQLDYSSGQERGAVREDDTWQGKMQAYEQVAQELAAEKAAAAAKRRTGEAEKVESGTDTVKR